MLSALGVQVTSLRNEFAESIADTDFLRRLNARHDVYITYDHRQKTRKAEAAALKESGLTALWFAPFWGKLVMWEQAKWLVHRWESIDAFASSVEPGTCAEIKQKGRAHVFQLK